MQCILWGQEKHGRAANTQGACSHICCGESPRALGQKVPLGDRKTLTLELTAKQTRSCGSGVLVLCSSKVMPWAFSRTPTERGSLFPCPLPKLGLCFSAQIEECVQAHFPSNYQQVGPSQSAVFGVQVVQEVITLNCCRIPGGKSIQGKTRTTGPLGIGWDSKMWGTNSTLWPWWLVISSPGHMLSPKEIQWGNRTCASPFLNGFVWGIFNIVVRDEWIKRNPWKPWVLILQDFTNKSVGKSKMQGPGGFGRTLPVKSTFDREWVDIYIQRKMSQSIALPFLFFDLWPLLVSLVVLNCQTIILGLSVRCVLLLMRVYAWMTAFFKIATTNLGWWSVSGSPE